MQVYRLIPETRGRRINSNFVTEALFVTTLDIPNMKDALGFMSPVLWMERDRSGDTLH